MYSEFAPDLRPPELYDHRYERWLQGTGFTLEGNLTVKKLRFPGDGHTRFLLKCLG